MLFEEENESTIPHDPTFGSIQTSHKGKKKK